MDVQFFVETHVTPIVRAAPAFMQEWWWAFVLAWLVFFFLLRLTVVKNNWAFALPVAISVLALFGAAITYAGIYGAYDGSVWSSACHDARDDFCFDDAGISRFYELRVLNADGSFNHLQSANNALAEVVLYFQYIALTFLVCVLLSCVLALPAWGVHELTKRRNEDVPLVERDVIRL